MYLDTKNLTTSGNISPVPVGATASKSMRRMRKVWQPLRRLLAVRRPTQVTLAHPNNVDLNNTQPLQQPQQQLHFEEQESKSTPEESTHKHGLELRTQPLEDEVSLMQPPNTPTLISSVYVEKVNAQGCRDCQHGRNCQHTHHSNINNSNNIANSNTASATQLPSAFWDLQLPLQYISTDNGTFFWANTQERVDDDLLHAWLCQSFSQMPGTLC
ncbi:hypothetical protein KR018_008168 [Drosophila ironensis]|nr:hypothetical protein KR018_008168 [Drosophila ironensis]